jgi:hypothetical protein
MQVRIFPSYSEYTSSVLFLYFLQIANLSPLLTRTYICFIIFALCDRKSFLVLSWKFLIKFTK